MKIWLNQTILRLFCSLAVLFTGPLAAQGLVMCIEADGGSNIELANLADPCASCPDETHSEEKSAALAFSENCGCLDIPLLSSAEKLSLQSAYKILPVFATVWPSSVASLFTGVDFYEPAAVNGCVVPELASDPLSLRRTVVFLI